MSSLRRTLFILVVVALLSTALAAKNKGKGKKKGKKGNSGKGKGNGNAVVNLSLGKCTANSVDYKVGESYSGDRCDVFTCKQVGSDYKFEKTVNETHCCVHDNKTYLVNDMFNSTKLNGTCSTKQLKCVNGSADYSKPAKIVEIYHHGVCCAYRHWARRDNEYFDEFYNGTMLNRYLNFTIYLEVGENITIPEKCSNLTCRLDEPMGLPALSLEIVHRACNCCIYNGTLYQDGHRNITLETGQNATCCSGQLVIPHNMTYNVTNGTAPAQPSAPEGSQTLPPPTVPPAPDAACWSSCFTPGDSYHDQFLSIVNKLREKQEAEGTKGTCFSLDASLSSSTSGYIYKYQRNIAMLLALTLPIDTDNPLFVNKFMNFGACSWYDPPWCCKTDKCQAAVTLAGPPATVKPSIATFQRVSSGVYLGMMWHGMQLADRAFKNTEMLSCAAGTSKQMVIPIVNKQWQQGEGPGGAYHPDWIGPDGGTGRTVATIGVDRAVDLQLAAAASSPDLSWKIGSTQDWHNKLHEILTCIDTKCCGGAVAAGPGGIPKSSPAEKDIIGNGTVY